MHKTEVISSYFSFETKIKFTHHAFISFVSDSNAFISFVGITEFDLHVNSFERWRRQLNFNKSGYEGPAANESQLQS